MSLDEASGATPMRHMQRHSLDSPETVLLKKQRVHANLQRANTIYSSNSPSSLIPSGRTSPLKRFGQAKQSIFETYGLIKDRLMDIKKFLVSAHGEGAASRVESLLNKTKGIEDILARDHMKVVFFGRTSNGKSTVINALLGSKILPSGIGHTTNCFCSVTGVEEDQGYILTPGSDERKDLKSLQQLAHSLYKDRLSTSNLIRVFWPKEKCSLLQADVEFVDSPGVDMNPDVDDWINNHCLNADVFVLVANSESTLMNAEKNFFDRVSERLSRPNIFILNNRWDASAHEPDMMKEVRQQHMENNLSFLTERLKVVDERTAKERVYFVSAKEVLIMRMRQMANEQNIGEGLADGHKGRLAEFESFELKLNTCLSSSAIHTKFEQHHSRGTEIIDELEQLLQTEDELIVNRSNEVAEKLQEMWLERRSLDDLNATVHDSASDILQHADECVKKNVSSRMKNVLGEIRGCIKSFEYSSGFDSGQLEVYKRSLYQHIDENLKTQMAHLCESSLVDPHQKACRDITALYQLLPQEFLSKNLPKIDPPNVPFSISSAEVCQGFVEDLEFRFSLGITSLTGFATRFNIGAIFLNIHRYASQISGHIPSEIAFPLTLVAGGFVLSRLMSWKYIIIPAAIYGGIWMFEKFTWTDTKKEQKLKEQVFKHLEERLHPQTVAIQNSYSSVLLSDLQRLYSASIQALSSFVNEKDNMIAKLTEEGQKLDELIGEAQKMKNSASFIRRDLESFKEEYLVDLTDN